MQRFTNSTFSIRKNRFKETGSKFESVSISSIDIGSSFNSIDYIDEFYTNYASTKEQKVYKIINELYSKIMNDDKNIFTDYIFDELYYKEKIIDRLINIINFSNNNKYSTNDLPKILKLKNKNEPKIHLYVTIDKNSAKIILIDLYHLTIPANVYSNGKLVKRVTISDLPDIYNKLKKNNYNLNNILKDNSKLILLKS